MFERINDRGSMVDAIVNQFKVKIQEGILKPGDLIPSENELVEKLGVSRGSVREAIKILNAFGIVTVKRGNGTYISDSIGNALIDPFLLTLMMNNNDICQLVEFRKMIEVQVVLMSVNNAREKDIENLEKVLLDMKDLIGRKNEKEKMVKADMMFHNALSDATHNIYVSKLYTYIMNFFETYIIKTYENEDNIISAYNLHNNIFKAIREKDRDMALEATKVSIEEWASKVKLG